MPKIAKAPPLDSQIDRAKRSLLRLRSQLLVERNTQKLTEIHESIAGTAIRLARLQVEQQNAKAN